VPDQQANDRHAAFERGEDCGDPEASACVETGEPDADGHREVVQPDSERCKDYGDHVCRLAVWWFTSGLDGQDRTQQLFRAIRG
jgi:hypothetical protein